LSNFEEVLLDKYGVEVELTPGEYEVALGINGSVKAFPVLRASWADLPAIFYLAWQEAPNIASSIQAVSVLRDWWVAKVATGEIPHGKLRYKDQDTTIELELAGRDLDVNKLADLILTFAKTKQK
jgi:hypothetical protein